MPDDTNLQAQFISKCLLAMLTVLLTVAVSAVALLYHKVDDLEKAFYTEITEMKSIVESLGESP